MLALASLLNIDRLLKQTLLNTIVSSKLTFSLSSLVSLGFFIHSIEIQSHCMHECVYVWCLCMNCRALLLVNPIPQVPPFFVASIASICWWVVARWEAYHHQRQPGRDVNHILTNTSTFKTPTYLIHPTTFLLVPACRPLATNLADGCQIRHTAKNLIRM